MLYTMESKLWSWGGRRLVHDGEDTHLWTVEGRALAIGTSLYVQDAGGTDRARIVQKRVEDLHSHEILVDERHVWTAGHAGFTPQACPFEAAPGASPMTATGSLVEGEYAFQIDGAEVARVSRGLATGDELYGVEVREGGDDLALLCAAVVIDLLAYEHQR